MTTPAVSARIRPVLIARMKDEVNARRAKDRTEVMERALCQYFNMEYVPIVICRSKGD